MLVDKWDTVERVSSKSQQMAMSPSNSKQGNNSSKPSDNYKSTPITNSAHSNANANSQLTSKNYDTLLSQKLNNISPISSNTTNNKNLIDEPELTNQYSKYLHHSLSDDLINYDLILKELQQQHQQQTSSNNLNNSSNGNNSSSNNKTKLNSETLSALATKLSNSAKQHASLANQTYEKLLQQTSNSSSNSNNNNTNNNNMDTFQNLLNKILSSSTDPFNQASSRLMSSFLIFHSLNLNYLFIFYLNQL
jgi:hypothetical protein